MKSLTSRTVADRDECICHPYRTGAMMIRLSRLVQEMGQSHLDDLSAFGLHIENGITGGNQPGDVLRFRLTV